MKLTINATTNIESKLSQIHSCACANISDPILQTEFVTVVSEIIYNIVKYCEHGEIEIFFKDGNIVICCQDVGVGYSQHYEEAFNEGFSTGGSLGLGMSCIVRFFDELFIETSDAGTVLNGSRSYN